MEQEKFYSKIKATQARANLIYSYRERYFNLWLNSWEWIGLNRDQREYVMRKLWETGAVAAFPLIDTSKIFLSGKKLEGLDNGFLGFATFAPYAYNMFNFPTAFHLINERGVPYIPNKLMVNNKDAVICYAQHSRAALQIIVFNMIERIVDVEMTIRTNLIAHKIPVVIEVTPDSEMHARDMQNKIEGDEPIFFTNVKDTDSIKAAGSGAPYILDKLYNYKCALENELNTFLGIDNMGNIEKKERLVTDEVNSNADLINDFSDAIGDNLSEFCKMLKDTLGFVVSVKPRNNPASVSKALGKPTDKNKGDINNGNENDK